MFIAISICFQSCEPGTVYREIQKLEDNRMQKDAGFTFEFENKDPLQVYDVVVLFRYVHGFQFNQVVLNFAYTNPEQETVDFTFGLTIRDADGNYIGDGSGDIWDIEHTVITNRALPQGTNTFTITNEMDKAYEYIPNCMAVGLKIVKR